MNMVAASAAANQIKRILDNENETMETHGARIDCKFES